MTAVEKAARRIADHMHIYNLRGYCWCGVHRDDWLRDEDMLENIGKAFERLARSSGEKKGEGR
jgi:hypothetical protein